VKVVEVWCREYNIKLNPAKSGILEVVPKYKKSCLKVGKEFRGIPIVDKYKYLGVWIDQRLSPHSHSEYLFGSRDTQGDANKKMKGKISFLTSSLSPCFRNVSFDYGANLWITFVKPLFLPLAALGTALTPSEKNLIQTKLRVSLKKFLKLPKSFKTEILDQVYPIDFLEWLQIENHNCRVKWDARALRQGDYNGMLKKYRVPRRKYLPREFRSLLSKFTAWCKVCC